MQDKLFYVQFFHLQLLQNSEFKVCHTVAALLYTCSYFCFYMLGHSIWNSFIPLQCMCFEIAWICCLPSIAVGRGILSWIWWQENHFRLTSTLSKCSHGANNHYSLVTMWLAQVCHGLSPAPGPSSPFAWSFQRFFEVISCLLTVNSLWMLPISAMSISFSLFALSPYLLIILI